MPGRLRRNRCSVKLWNVAPFYNCLVLEVIHQLLMQIRPRPTRDKEGIYQLYTYQPPICHPHSQIVLCRGRVTGAALLSVY